MIRIALRSDNRLLRDALAGWLDARPECAVVGTVAELRDLPLLCELRRPDVVLADIGAGLAAHPDAPARLRGCVALATVIVVYQRLSAAELGALWQLGIETMVPHSHGLDALLVELRRHITEEHAKPRRTAGARDALTDQEAKVITLLGAGHTADRIAGLLKISTSAVANTKRRIYRKLEVASESQAVARATALGMVARPTARGSFTAAAVGPGPAELTSRENDILRSIADGHTVRQTARSLGIAEKTVENTQARLFRKLGVRNRAGALIAAHALGLVDLLPAPRGPS